jgi:hypothetical protein
MDNPFHRLMGRTGPISRAEFNTLLSTAGAAFQAQTVTTGPGLFFHRDKDGTIISSKPPPNREKRHAFQIRTLGAKVTVAPGTISSIEAKIGENYLSSLDENGKPPTITLGAGRHVIALKIEWEAISYDINEDVEGLDPYFILGAGGSCVKVEVVHKTEAGWPTTIEEDTVWPEADSATGDVTNGIFFQRLGLVEVSATRITIGNPPNDGLKSSANVSFCPPQSFTLIPLP